MAVPDVIAQMHKELAEVSLIDKDTQDATFHGAKAICTGSSVFWRNWRVFANYWKPVIPEALKGKATDRLFGNAVHVMRTRRALRRRVSPRAVQEVKDKPRL